MPADIRYAEWVSGADSRLPLDAALVPFLEQGASSEPPTAPTLIRELSTVFAVRTTHTFAGRVRTTPLAARPRARFNVSWTAVAKPQRDAIWSWWLDELDAGARGFALRIDGPDADPITVIFDADLQEQEVDRGIYSLSAPALEIFA